MNMDILRRRHMQDKMAKYDQQWNTIMNKIRWS